MQTLVKKEKNCLTLCILKAKYWIDYAPVEAHTTYGCIGVKVWICRGIVYGRRDLFANEAAKEQRPAGGGKKMFRGPRRDRDDRRGGERRGERRDNRNRN